MTPAERTHVDTVVVTCNSAVDLVELASCPLLDGEVRRLFVVDNASTDRSREIAAARGATVIRRHTTRGYGAAANVGVAHCEGPFIALLNPDIRFVEPATVERLLSAFDDPRVAIVAPGLRLPDRSLQDSARTVPTPVELLLRRRMNRSRGAVRDGGQVPWVTGAFVLIRRAAFDELGGFDERFPLYFEDVDLCVRAWRAGWQVVYRPDIVAEHRHRAESRRSLFGVATSRHLEGAARFYVKHPRHLVASQM